MPDWKTRFRSPRIGGVRALRQLRALLLLGYLAVMGLMLLPSGHRMGSRAVWRTELIQAQFADWAAALSHFGISMTPKEFERKLWRLVRGYLSVQRPMARSLLPLGQHLGIGQSWKMFSNPQTHPSRIHIDVDRGTGFRPVYVSRSATHNWNQALFDDGRMRKLVGRIGRGGEDSPYPAFVHWTEAQIREDFPDARRLRVRLYRWRTPPPSNLLQPYDSGGHYEAQRVLRLRKP